MFLLFNDFTIMTPKNVKCNFSAVFAQFNTIEEITELANHICAQVKSAYDVRKGELEENEITVEAVVEIETEEVAEEPKKGTKLKKSASKTERAKEMAAMLKKEKTESKNGEKAKKEKADSKNETKTEASDETLISITDTAEIKKLGLKFEKYNDKCYVLRGNTKPLRKILKEEYKGVYNSRLNGGEGWVISAKHAENCAKALGLKVKAA